MRARHLLLASAFTAALAAGGLANLPAASAAAGTISGYGIGSDPFTAQYNAEADARRIAAANGFEPYAQCSLISNQAYQSMPNFYQANAMLYCQN